MNITSKLDRITFHKGQKLKFLFDKNTYTIIKVSGKCIFVEDEDCGISSFYYDYLINNKKLRIIKK